MKTKYYTLNNLHNVAKEKIKNTIGMSDLQKCVLQEKYFSSSNKEASNTTGNKVRVASELPLKEFYFYFL